MGNAEAHGLIVSGFAPRSVGGGVGAGVRGTRGWVGWPRAPGERRGTPGHGRA